MSKPEDFKFDSRVRDRLLRSRVLVAADVKQHLEQLPDLEGEYEVLDDTPQPAVTPPRDHHVEEPIVFDGIRRLQALSDPHSSLRAAPSSAVVSSVPQPAREPVVRSFGSVPDVSRGPSPALRSALMESEIYGVGAGAVSAALGAMSPEARSAAGFPATMPVVSAPSSEREPHTPVTLRSQATPESLKEDAVAEEDEDEDDEDDEDADDEDADDADADDADADDDEDSDDDDDDDDEDEDEAGEAKAGAAVAGDVVAGNVVAGQPEVGGADARDAEAGEAKAGVVADWEAPYPDSEDVT
ncbi:MAG: hypothetical protein RL685_1897 [Pseudomonadota bacterium]|jgi:hypothetical protein